MEMEERKRGARVSLRRLTFGDRVRSVDRRCLTLRSRFVRLDLVNPKLGGTIGCVTDITPRKRDEVLQQERLAVERLRREEAEAERRQQELLIDVTS